LSKQIGSKSKFGIIYLSKINEYKKYWRWCIIIINNHKWLK
jgi:hypothetical protein